MTIEELRERRAKLGDELQRAIEQRDRLRGMVEEASTVCERMRGAVMLLDDMIASEPKAAESPASLSDMPAVVPEEARAA
jgi:hypothetical protein